MFLFKLSRSPEERSRLNCTTSSDAPFEKFTFSELCTHVHLRVKESFFFLNVVDGTEKLFSRPLHVSTLSRYVLSKGPSTWRTRSCIVRLQIAQYYRWLGYENGRVRTSFRVTKSTAYFSRMIGRDRVTKNLKNHMFGKNGGRKSLSSERNEKFDNCLKFREKNQTTIVK